MTIEIDRRIDELCRAMPAAERERFDRHVREFLRDGNDEITDEMVKAGDVFLQNPDYKNISPAQIRAIYRAMTASRRMQRRNERGAL